VHDEVTRPRDRHRRREGDREQSRQPDRRSRPLHLQLRRARRDRGGDRALLLFDSPVSGNCYKVRLLLAQLGVEYERRALDVIDRSNRAAVLGGLNPALRVPTLVLDDGRPLAESNAIICFLAEGTPLLPVDRYERAQVLQWLFFEQYSHEPYIAVVRFWVHVAHVDHPEIETRRKGGALALDAMESHLRDRAFLVAERYTVADIALYAYTHVADEGGFELARYPAIDAWLERVRLQPGHVPIDA
jgi:glutathione S-transferase